MEGRRAYFVGIVDIHSLGDERVHFVCISRVARLAQIFATSVKFADRHAVLTICRPGERQHGNCNVRGCAVPRAFGQARLHLSSFSFYTARSPARAYAESSLTVVLWPCFCRRSLSKEDAAVSLRVILFFDDHDSDVTCS